MSGLTRARVCVCVGGEGGGACGGGGGGLTTVPFLF